MHTRLVLGALLCALVSLTTVTARAQGALTPPGAPAPMFKTLDQLEARKTLGTPNAVTTSTIVISEPGSYVLVGPVTVASGNGIEITTGNVTLDLNGFTISSTAFPRAGSGVRASNRGVVVRNGIIAGAGIDTGYTLDGNASGFHNGVALGAFTGDVASFFKEGTTVENVTCGAFPGYGILADLVRNCAVLHGGSAGISGGSVFDSSVETYSSSPALKARGIASRCRVGYGYANPQPAVQADVIDTCHATISGGYGMVARLIKHSIVSVASSSGTPFTAEIAIGCISSYSAPGAVPTNNITHKYDMP